MAKKKRSFVRSFILVFWLAVIGFVLYRSVLLVPQDRDKLYLVYTKFNGYQNHILYANQYYINWQNLLPGNVELLPISSTPQKIQLRKQAILPGAESYSSLLPGSISAENSESPFTYKIELSLRYRIKPEEILAFARNPANSIYNAEKLNLDPVSAWRLDLSEKVQRSLEQKLESLFDDATSLPDIFAVETHLSEFLTESFPELEILNVDVTKYQLPDLELYATVKQNYQTLLQEISGQALAGLLEDQNKRIDQQLYLQNIEQMGEILTKYPILIQYFAVANAELRNDILQNILK